MGKRDEDFSVPSRLRLTVSSLSLFLNVRLFFTLFRWFQHIDLRDIPRSVTQLRSPI